jgi:hypothetical protein
MGKQEAALLAAGHRVITYDHALLDFIGHLSRAVSIRTPLRQSSQ